MEPRSIDINNESEDYEIFRSLEVKDPLADVNAYTEIPKYYRHTETVFAEPITNNIIKNKDGRGAEEMYVLDNVIVHKRPGKRHKYYINVDMHSSSCKCPQTNCNKSFSTMTLLRAHIRKVHCVNSNNFICEHCGSGFSAKYLLERHMAIHTGEKVECPVCGKMLSRRTNLSVHLRLHSATRSHTCQLCGRGFVRRATLDAHLRFVHRTGELRCNTCDERFPTRKLLASHKSCLRSKTREDLVVSETSLE